MPNSAWPTPCFDGGKVSTMIACEVATRAPPPSPCTSRQKISCSTVCEAPHRSDDAVNTQIEEMK
jgi:hypothetical protein